MDDAKEGALALEKKDFPTAIAKYTTALTKNHTAVDYYIKRSTAFHRSTPPDCISALRDAEIAVALAHKRQKKELIEQAQLRRAIVLFISGRYGDSSFCLKLVEKSSSKVDFCMVGITRCVYKEKSIPMWRAKIDSKIQSLSPEDENLKVTVQEVPDINLGDLTNNWNPAKGEVNIPSKLKAPEPANTLLEPPVYQAPVKSDKPRHEWYQTLQTVTITLFVKNVPQTAEMEIEENSIDIYYPLASGGTFNWSLQPLFAAVDTKSSTYRITPQKVEFTLKKKVPNQKWTSLEGTKDSGLSVSVNIFPRELLKNKPPVYPTSSRRGPKNWDKVVDNLTAKKSAGSGVEEFESYDDEDYGDPAGALFKKLYQNADPDTRRAMVKSYQESNGTSLSTNWDEVKKHKVETVPPEGTTAKKWNE
ncbi:MAG: hypothetical protein M1834_004395 [Cirrosporium novae-zelandiae]|nr:MAG: hypothetical protein M1834_004395 [Cirrosporium novae-zelandiae]